MAETCYHSSSNRRTGNPRSAWATEPAQGQGWVTWTLGNYHNAWGIVDALAKRVVYETQSLTCDTEKQRKQARQTDSSRRDQADFYIFVSFPLFPSLLTTSNSNSGIICMEPLPHHLFWLTGDVRGKMATSVFEIWRERTSKDLVESTGL